MTPLQIFKLVTAVQLEHELYPPVPELRQLDLHEW